VHKKNISPYFSLFVAVASKLATSQPTSSSFRFHRCIRCSSRGFNWCKKRLSMKSRSFFRLHPLSAYNKSTMENCFWP